MVHTALEAAEQLEKEGLSAAVINMSSIKPLDEKAIVSAARDTGAIVTVEEHSIIGGLGGAVCEIVSSSFPVPVKRVGVLDRFCSSGSAEELVECYNLNVKTVLEAARASLEMKNNGKK